MFVAGRVICMTGGHACWVGIECNGSERRPRRRPRATSRLGVDHLKLIATGGVMTAGVEPGAPQLEEDEMRESSAARRSKAGRRIAAHAQGTEGIQNARCAPASTPSSTASTSTATPSSCSRRPEPCWCRPSPPPAASWAAVVNGVPDYMVDKMEVVGRAHDQSFRRCHANRVPFAAGTDSGTPLNPHGSIAVELEAMVECGATPMEAILSATSRAAEVLGRTDMGTLEPSRRADLLVVDGDPSQQISDIRNVSCVWKEGVVVAGSTMRQEVSA